MKFYTVQKLKSWEYAQSKGYLQGYKEYIDEEWFDNSYSWMMLQMSKRLKKYNGEYPIWLWLDLSNIQFSELIEDDWVLLEIELKEEDVLMSNFDAWHVILNDGDFFDFYNHELTKEESWEVIFDKSRLEYNGYDCEEDELQATTGKIDIKNIKVIKYIIGNISI